MNPASEDVKDLLEAESALALEFATDLFIGKEPLKPNNTVTIFDTPGSPAGKTLDTGLEMEYPAIQIRVRNINYMAGYTLAKNIKDLLHNRAQETVNGTLYCAIHCMQGPALLDWDANDRARFVMTFNLMRR